MINDRSSGVSGVPWTYLIMSHFHIMPGVGLTVRVVGLGFKDPEFKSCSVVQLIPGGVDSACHPSEVGRMIASLLVYCVGVATCPGFCPIAQETA